MPILHPEPAPTSTDTTIDLLRSRIAELEAELAVERMSPQTHLPARRWFGRLAEAAYPDAGAVLLGDVDGLKQINDQHGHQAGDQLIAEIADRLRTTLGAASVIGHLSGDEFAAVLPLEPAPHHLDRVHDWLTDPFQLVNGKTITPGMSLGLISGEQLAEITLPEAMHGADMAMYAAKRAGGGWRRYEPAEHGPLAVELAPLRRVRHQARTRR